MTILGIIFILVGTLWGFQGAGLVGGSFMTGRSEWFYIGIATAVAGGAILVWKHYR